MFNLFRKKNSEDKLLLKLKALEGQFNLAEKGMGGFEKGDIKFVSRTHIDDDNLPFWKIKDYTFEFEDDNVLYEVHYIKDYPNRSLHISRKKKIIKIAEYEKFPEIHISYWKDEPTIRPLLNKEFKAEEVSDILQTIRVNAYRLISESYISKTEHDIEVNKLKNGEGDEKRLYIV